MSDIFDGLPLIKVKRDSLPLFKGEIPLMDKTTHWNPNKTVMTRIRKRMRDDDRINAAAKYAKKYKKNPPVANKDEPAAFIRWYVTSDFGKVEYMYNYNHGGTTEKVISQFLNE